MRSRYTILFVIVTLGLLLTLVFQFVHRGSQYFRIHQQLHNAQVLHGLLQNEMVAPPYIKVPLFPADAHIGSMREYMLYLKKIELVSDEDCDFFTAGSGHRYNRLEDIPSEHITITVANISEVEFKADTPFVLVVTRNLADAINSQAAALPHPDNYHAAVWTDGHHVIRHNVDFKQDKWADQFTTREPKFLGP